MGKESEMRPETQLAIDRILDTFAGVGGGANYVKFMALVYAVDKQAAEGDTQAEEVVKVITRFSKLIEVAQTDIPRKKEEKK